MSESFPFDRVAQEHIKVLVEGIGPRPAGSKQENQAFEYIDKSLRNLGYGMNSYPAPFAPLPNLNISGILSGLFVILSGYYFEQLPWLTIWVPLVTLLLLQIDRVIEDYLPKTEMSQNLFAFSGEEDLPLLVICAHVDSAKCTAFKIKIFRWLNSQTLKIIQRVSFLVCFVSLISLIGFGIPVWLNILVKFSALLSGSWFIGSEMINQFSNKGKYSPGALDNASGVGVLLSLAEYYSVKLPSKIRLGFLFTGAEETGLHGSKGFSKTLSLSIPTFVINVDMVGAGQQLYYVEKEGILFIRRTHTELNRQLKIAFPEIKPIDYSVRSGDYAPFVKLGIPSVSLQTGGSKEADLSYHSQFDTFDLIDSGSLNKVCQTVIKFIEILPDSQLIMGRR